MPSKKYRVSFSKTFIVTVSVILLLVLAGIIGWNLVKYKFIKGKVKSAIFEKTNGLYTIHYDRMDLDEASGYLYVTNLKIIPDTAKFRTMIAAKTNPPLVLELTVPELEIAGVKTPEAMLNKKVSGRRLQIKNADVLFYYAKAPSDTGKNMPREEMYRQLLGDLNQIQVDTVDVSNVSLSFIGMLNGKKNITATSLSVHLKDVLIDSLHSQDSSRFFFSKHIEVSGDSALIKNKPGTYFYRFTGFSFNTDGGLFSIQSLAIEPQLGEAKFAAFSEVQKDRFNISLKKIALRKINLARLMDTDIIADDLVIGDASIKIFRDLSYPRDKTSRSGKFPHQLLMKMPVTVALNKIAVNSAFIEYKEKNPKSDYSGRVQFADAHAVIVNVTNDLSRIKKNNHCLLSFQSSFLGMAPMHANLDMLLNNDEGKFAFSGGMKAFDADKLNVLIEPMGLARIEKGRVNDVQFNFGANQHGSNGKLTLLYEDLKITLLKKDSAEHKLEKKKLASFVANLVVKNANPLRKQPVRTAEVHYIHDANRSFFNLMWKSIYAGVKQSAGM